MSAEENIKMFNIEGNPRQSAQISGKKLSRR
jgi:hypothetical protein